MIGLDCNILVQLAFADHPGNAKTVAAVQVETSKGQRLVFPSLVIAEFLHVATDDRRFAPPLTMAEALQPSSAKNYFVPRTEPNDRCLNRALFAAESRCRRLIAPLICVIFKTGSATKERKDHAR
jgi:predicted nucleic acid-binding protein